MIIQQNRQPKKHNKYVFFMPLWSLFSYFPCFYLERRKSIKTYYLFFILFFIPAKATHTAVTLS